MSARPIRNACSTPSFTPSLPARRILTRYTNPKLDRLLDDALMAPEGPAQAKLYSQIQKTIVDDVPMVFLYHSTRMAAYADRVKGLELNLGALPHDKLVTVDLAP